MYNGSSFRHWASSNLTTTPGTYKNVYLYTRATEVAPETVTLAELVTKDVNKKYTVTDLQCVKIIPMAGNNAQLICKDNGHYADKDVIENGQIDYMGKNYDQSNWVILNVSGVTFADASLEGHMLTGVTGKLINKVNPEMTLDAKPTAVGDEVVYNPNTYIVPSFKGTQEGNDGETYFFVQPKPMEYMCVEWAMWDGSKFVVAESSANENANVHGLQGSFGVEWTYMTAPEGLNDALTSVYKIEGIAKVGTAGSMMKTATGGYTVMPTSITKTGDVVTAVNDVKAAGEVLSVTYYNVAGVQSSKPFDGINIVVTRYTDGTASTAKVVR